MIFGLHHAQRFLYTVLMRSRSVFDGSDRWIAAGWALSFLAPHLLYADRSF
jgi:hypothetical protein